MRPEVSAELAVAPSGEPVRVLTDAEGARLRELEAVVDRDRDGFDRVLAALEEIRSGRLYRATHATFRDYLRERFGFSPSYASRLRRAGAVVEEARRLSPDVAHGQPPAERAVREVNDLPVEEAAKILVVATAAARAEGREAPVVADVRKARRSAVVDRGPEVKAKPGRKADPRDPRLDELDKLLRSLAVIPRGKGDKAKAVLVHLGDAVIRLVRTMGSIARKSEIELGRHLAMLDAIVETVEELTWREATPEPETQVALHVAEVWGVTPEEVVEAGELATAIDTLKATDPEIEAKFLSGDGPSREEILEKARTVETVALAGQTCVRCGATAPLGERLPHRAPCVAVPKATIVVEAGQVWKTKHGKFFLVERVVDDKAVVNLGDGQASGWTEIARVLGEATLVPRPTKAVLAKFERPIMEFSIGPRRRRK